MEEQHDLVLFLVTELEDIIYEYFDVPVPADNAMVALNAYWTQFCKTKLFGKHNKHTLSSLIDALKRKLDYKETREMYATKLDDKEMREIYEIVLRCN